MYPLPPVPYPAGVMFTTETPSVNASTRPSRRRSSVTGRDRGWPAVPGRFSSRLARPLPSRAEAQQRRLRQHPPHQRPVRRPRRQTHRELLAPVEARASSKVARTSASEQHHQRVDRYQYPLGGMDENLGPGSTARSERLARSTPPDRQSRSSRRSQSVHRRRGHPASSPPSTLRRAVHDVQPSCVR